MAQDARWINIFGELYQEWELDLSEQEQEVWLWNAIVEIKKIKQRREPFQDFVELCRG